MTWFLEQKPKAANKGGRGTGAKDEEGEVLYGVHPASIYTSEFQSTVPKLQVLDSKAKGFKGNSFRLVVGSSVMESLTSSASHVSAMEWSCADFQACIGRHRLGARNQELELASDP